jgi:uncharacterized protein
MVVVGTVESLWRYPVKSMAGEQIDEAFVGFSGFYGDRIFAIHDGGALKGFPFFTGREQEQMVRYKPRFRHPQQAMRPPNLADAESLGPGLTPLYGSGGDWMVDVEVPTGEILSIDDAALISGLLKEPDKQSLSLIRSDRSMTDCRPISMFSVQTIRQLCDEIGFDLDKRRFRANIYADMQMGGFAENSLVDRKLQIGLKVVLTVVGTDPRCKIITIDPDTGETKPEILRTVARVHDGSAGLYGAVVVEGVVRPGDDIALLD